jgi:hypothetical protein
MNKGLVGICWGGPRGRPFVLLREGYKSLQGKAMSEKKIETREGCTPRGLTPPLHKNKHLSHSILSARLEYP